MEKLIRKLSASVLPTVLVVGTLLLLGTLLIMQLWDWHALRYRIYHRHEQDRLHIESGYLLYAQDSTLFERLREDSTFLLYEGREDSRLQINRIPWGMYETVQVRTVGSPECAVRLFGKSCESSYSATLYIPENERSFSLAGNTSLEGKLYLSGNGVAYTQMRSEFFTGRKVRKQQLARSTGQFPGKEREIPSRVEEMIAERESVVWEGDTLLKRSFRDPPLLLEVGAYLNRSRIKGHIVLFTSGDLFIEQNNELEDVIVWARKVEVADGFCGTLQIFARDSILLGDRVCLKQGSGLCITGQETTGRIGLGEFDEINGFVLAENGPTDSGEIIPVYRQPQTSKVRGLVYIDGIAEIHGMITGSLYARDCYYFAPEGYYSGILYNAVLPGNPGVAYPLFMEGPYVRKEVKWVY